MRLGRILSYIIKVEMDIITKMCSAKVVVVSDPARLAIQETLYNNSEIQSHNKLSVVLKKWILSIQYQVERILGGRIIPANLLGYVHRRL